MDATVNALHRKCLRAIISEDNRETWNIRSQCDIRNILILRFLDAYLIMRVIWETVYSIW
jgi:hypothetical protein